MSELVKVAVSELEGAALDWAVAKATGAPCYRDGDIEFWLSDHRFAPSTSYMFGGPLIAEKVAVTVDTENGCYADCGAQAHAVKHQRPLDDYDGSGPTMLIACMRAIVSSELGPEIEVPRELVT